jgi:hypothetical protein
MLNRKDLLAFLIWFAFLGLVAYGLVQLTAGRGPGTLATATPVPSATPVPTATPVPSPEPEVPDAAIVWTAPGEPCQTARIGSQAIAYGACGGTLLKGGYAPGMEAERLQQYQDYVATYAPFKAETPAGSVDFTGTGTQVATAAEQRMIAGWAGLVALEAAQGRSETSYGLLLTWHREGGLKGFCDDLAVHATGWIYATSCKGNEPVELGRRRLTAEELAQVFAWVDAYKSFEYGHKDPATVDALTVRLVFSGAGMGEADPQPMLDFAATLYTSVAVP